MICWFPSIESCCLLAGNSLIFLLSNLYSISYSCLRANAVTSDTILNSSGESVHPCVVLDVDGNAYNLSVVNMMTVVCSYITLILLRNAPSSPYLVFFC